MRRQCELLLELLSSMEAEEDKLKMVGEGGRTTSATVMVQRLGVCHYMFIWGIWSLMVKNHRKYGEKWGRGVGGKRRGEAGEGGIPGWVKGIHKYCRPRIKLQAWVLTGALRWLSTTVSGAFQMKGGSGPPCPIHCPNPIDGAPSAGSRSLGRGTTTCISLFGPPNSQRMKRRLRGGQRRGIGRLQMSGGKSIGGALGNPQVQEPSKSVAAHAVHQLAPATSAKWGGGRVLGWRGEVRERALMYGQFLQFDPNSCPSYLSILMSWPRRHFRDNLRKRSHTRSRSVFQVHQAEICHGDAGYWKRGGVV